MSKLPIVLAEIDSIVLDDSDLGVKVDDNRRKLDELTVSCYFTLPKMVAGRFRLLAITRSRPGDSRTYIDVVYDAASSIIEVRNNADGGSVDLVVKLRGATPEQICSQVLALDIEVSQDRIFAAVHNDFAGGGLHFRATGSGERGSAKRQPWGASPAGHWQVLPSTLGLSGLRLTLASETDEALGPLLYQGALDHLVAEPPDEDEVARIFLRQSFDLVDFFDFFERF